MAGHSKWANIKHKKEKSDSRRGKVFTKLARQIAIAAREGGGDANANFRLRLAMDAARKCNMPNELIDRAIKRGTGDSGSDEYEEIMYEGYGPAGIAFLLDIATDNRNRTAGEVRFIMSKNSGSLGEAGCVAWMFDKKGVVRLTGPDLPAEDEVMLAALEAGAEDVYRDDDGFEVICAPEDFQAVQEGLQQAGFAVAEAELSMRPQNTINVGPEEAQQLIDLIEALEDNEDVQSVYTNMELSPETLAALEDL